MIKAFIQNFHIIRTTNYHHINQASSRLQKMFNFMLWHIGYKLYLWMEFAPSLLPIYVRAMQRKKSNLPAIICCNIQQCAHAWQTRTKWFKRYLIVKNK